MDHSSSSGSRTLPRVLRYGPVLFWIGLIWLASTHGFSSGNTSRIIRPLLLWFLPNLTEPQIATAHTITRKAAHFTEYAILAFLARRAFITSSRNFLREHWFAMSLLVVAFVSMVDELHQSLVPSRTGSIFDNALDLAGGLFMLMICRIYQRSRHLPSSGSAN